MPRLISGKNLAYPRIDGQVLSSDSKGVQSWVDNKIVGISTLGSAVGTANTIKFASGIGVTIVAGVASVSVDRVSFTASAGIASALNSDSSINTSGIITASQLAISGITTSKDLLVTGVVTATTFSGNLPTTDLTGTITNAQLAGSIANAKLVNDSVSFGGVSLDLGG